ncbi:MAG: YHS domain-containing (seleno)protein [Bacteroidota bacterium]
MNFYKSIILGIIMILVSSLSIQAQDYKTFYNVDDSKIALQGYSPVSYVDLGLAQRGSKSIKSEHEGIAYYFTSEDQKAAFDKNPEKYLPQYGGWCATGIGVGAKFRTDPNKFLLRNGKLYLFLYSMEVDALELWKKDEAKLTASANKNWKKLQSTH